MGGVYFDDFVFLAQVERKVGNQKGTVRWRRWVRRVEMACESILFEAWDVVGRVDMIEKERGGGVGRGCGGEFLRDG